MLKNNKTERRQFVRVNKRLPVSFSNSETYTAQDAIKAISNDISIGGMQINTRNKKLPPLNKKLQFIINFPKNNLSINITAEVVWLKKKNYFPTRYNCGIKFIDLEGKTRSRISSYIQESQLSDSRSISYKLDNFIYKVVIKNILILSKLGRNSIRGEADSGLNFDHMYTNKPEGFTLLGKTIDRILLNLPAVQATRNRKINILKIIENEVENNLILGNKTKIMDIASGPARYLNELMSVEYKNKIEVLCLDRDSNSISKGKDLFKNLPVRFLRANILNASTLINFAEKVSWRPNIVIISGLFVYLENNLVKQSLINIFKYLAKDGLIIFSSQLDNPSRKLMEKVCKTQSGKSWELYYRNAKEIRKLLIEIGYKYSIISLDPWGMYQLCTGRKTNSNGKAA